MALAQALLCLISLVFFWFAFTCCGRWLLRRLAVRLNSSLDELLVSTALGIICTETLLLIVEFSQRIRLGSYGIVGFLFIFFAIEIRGLAGQVTNLGKQLASFSKLENSLLLFIAITVAVEFLIASAPLTGSDAQHYHFTAQKLILEQGFHPIFSIAESFLCGQHHSLILFGLALGSERLALGFIFLGGVLTSIVLARLAAQWASKESALFITLLFLVTPVVFWQISNSGSPDIFMAFFLGTAMLVLNQQLHPFTSRLAIVAGLLTGGVAGGKYSGCFIAFALLICVFWEFRRISLAVPFLVGAALGGISPYLRNFAWTRNPIFPYLSQRLSPQLVTSYALYSLASATGATQQHNFRELLPFVLFAHVKASNVGLFDFFGPIVLVVAPIIVAAVTKTRPWRIALVVWSITAVTIYFSSGLLRFLLPIFPVALACVAAAISWINRKEWVMAKSVVLGVMFLVFAGGFVGLLVYGQKPIAAAVGLKSRETYLRETAQEFEAAEAVNSALASLSNHEKALVFMRHLYYLQIPFVNGDPGNNFEIDPARMNTADSWMDYFNRQHITHVVRGAQYPKAIADPLSRMESEGLLVLVNEINVKSFSGMRIDKNVVTVPVFILKVTNKVAGRDGAVH
ncbi:MAG: hypothetical protein C5B47_04590 [Verrucomicrobia bacterium]|nr:MAG: hypothetical protein C5B47_04590 [Verrucomicrobiota bacterium]